VKEVVSGVAAALGVVGAIVYGLQRVAYEQFYDEFGIAPEDVGIDAVQVLSQTAVGVATWMVLTLLIALLPAAGATAVTYAVGRRYPKVSGLARRVGVCVLGVIALTNGLWTLILNNSAAENAAKCAARRDGTGQPVRGLKARFPAIRWSGVRADRAVLKSTEPGQPAPPSKRTVFYLGHSQGSAIVYVPSTQRVLRVPASTAVVSVDAAARAFTATKGCRPIRRGESARRVRR